MVADHMMSVTRFKPGFPESITHDVPARARRREFSEGRKRRRGRRR
jgi:hypothetical protein